MANIIKPPLPFREAEGFKIFLAGSIEMGAAANWQETIEQAFKEIESITIFNPRRDDWDSTWEQSIHNPQFNQQVNWELSAMDYADFIAMYFDPYTKSPITLLELGLHIYDKTKLVVCCPQGFWRKGNVDIVCDKYSIRQVDTIEQLIVSICMGLSAKLVWDAAMRKIGS